MAGSANNILISPVNCYWRIESEAQLDCSALSNPDGTYLTLSSPNDDYYVWFDLDSSSVDPAPAGKTAVEVSVTTGDSPATIATALQTALDGLSDFSASVSGSLVTYLAADVGEVTDPADVDSGVVVVICKKGKNFDLGLLQGDIEATLAPANFEITAHQTGVTKLGVINQGLETNEAAIVLQETTRSKLKELYKIWGGAFTPSTSEVFGVGTAAVGKNMLIEAARLEMEPVNDQGSELSYKYTIMLAVPVPESLVFSGENPRVLNSSWQGFPDLSKDSRVDSVLIGDVNQTGI